MKIIKASEQEVENFFNEIFDESMQKVRQVKDDVKTYYVAKDVVKILGFTNITNTISKINCEGHYGIPYALTIKKKINNYNNKCSKMHLLTLIGVVKLILSSKTDKCNLIKSYVSDKIVNVLNNKIKTSCIEKE